MKFLIGAVCIGLVFSFFTYMAVSRRNTLKKLRSDLPADEEICFFSRKGVLTRDSASIYVYEHNLGKDISFLASRVLPNESFIVSSDGSHIYIHTFEKSHTRHRKYKTPLDVIYDTDTGKE